MEQRWNGTDREKPKNSDKKLYHCHKPKQSDLGANPVLRGEKPVKTMELLMT
jgi:hypothetical protein